MVTAVNASPPEPATAPTPAPKYPIGTTFLKLFKGFGVWQGEITSVDGDTYHVIYPEDEHEEEFKCSRMEVIMAKSERLVEKIAGGKLRVATREMDLVPVKTSKDEQQLDGMTGEPTPFRVGQHVWVVTDNGMLPAIIHSVGGSSVELKQEDVPTEMMRIRWSKSRELEDVKLESILPMSDRIYGKRKRKQPDVYVPYAKAPKLEEELPPMCHNSKKKLLTKKEEPSRGDVRDGGVASQKLPSDVNSPNTPGRGPYYHDGFRYHFIKLCKREPGWMYRCSQHQTARCPVKLCLNSNTGMARTYTSKGELVEHTNECKRRHGMIEDPPVPSDASRVVKEKSGPGGGATAKKSSSGQAAVPIKRVASQKKTPKASKRHYHHEGIKFTFLKSTAAADLYQCSYRRSTDCPVKLKINLETGMAQTYTSKGGPAEHTEECKRRNGIVEDPSVPSDASKVANREAGASEGAMATKSWRNGIEGNASRAPNGTFHHNGFKYCHLQTSSAVHTSLYRCSHFPDCHVRLWATGEPGGTLAYTSNGEHTEECKRKNATIADPAPTPPDAPNVASNGSTRGGGTPDEKEGASDFHERRRVGKSNKSFACRKRALKGWETRRKNEGAPPLGKVEPEQVERGKGVRAPPGQNDGLDHSLEHTNQVEIGSPRHFTEGQDVWVSMGKAKHPAVIVSVTNDAKDEGSKMATVRWTTTNTVSEVKVKELFPMFEDDNGNCVASSFSKRERKDVNRFVPPERPLKKTKLQEKQKASMPREGHKTSVAPGVARTQNAKLDDPDYIRENLDTISRIPSGVSPGRGWKSKVDTSGQFHLTRWISPQEGIIFKFPKAAFEFDVIKRQCHGDEQRALELYERRIRASGRRPHMFMMNLRQLRTTKEVHNPHLIQENLDTIKTEPSGDAPGPGWTPVVVLDRKGKQATRWISPGDIIFRKPRAAFKFEEIRRQCKNEERALELYLGRRQAAGKKAHIMSQERLEREIQREKTVKVREKTVKDAFDPAGATSVKAKSNAQGKDDPESLDEHENMTLAEIRTYNLLWDSYLKPTTRENEELPGGMILRKRTASCNLLRFKNSVFRRKLHGKILRLERSGRKNEILRLLIAINDHDKSMRSGDGPQHLLEEILGTQNGEVEILDAAAFAAMKRSHAVSPNNCPEGLTGSCAPIDLVEEIRANDTTSGASTSGEELADPKREVEDPCMKAENDKPLASNKIRRGEAMQPPDEDTDHKMTAHIKMLAEESDGNKSNASKIQEEVMHIPSEEISVGSDEIKDMRWVNGMSFKSTGIPAETDGQTDDPTLTVRNNHALDDNSEAKGPLSDASNEMYTPYSDVMGKPIDSPNSLENQLKVVDLCENGGLDEELNPSELVRQQGHQQQAVRSVLQEWVSEEATAGISIASSITHDDVERIAHDNKQVDSKKMWVATSRISAKSDQTREVDENSSQNSQETCEVIDLCDEDCRSKTPALSDLVQGPSHQLPVTGGSGQRSVGEDNVSRVTNDSADTRASIDNALEGHQNRLDSSQQPSHMDREQPEVIDISQEGEDLPALNANGVIVID